MRCCRVLRGTPKRAAAPCGPAIFARRGGQGAADVGAFVFLQRGQRGQRGRGGMGRRCGRCGLRCGSAISASGGGLRLVVLLGGSPEVQGLAHKGVGHGRVQRVEQNAADHVAQLTDIAGPGVFVKGLDHAVRQPGRAQLVFRSELLDEVVHK